MYLIFDTETTGLPRDFSAPVTDLDNWPRLVQLSWQLHGPKGELIERGNHIVKPDGFTIPFNAEKVHGISTQRALDEGEDLNYVLDEFEQAVQQAQVLIGHNVGFDEKITGAEYLRMEREGAAIFEAKYLDTKDEATDYCAIPGGMGGRYKWPNLTELHEKLFGEPFQEAHNAAFDVDATARCFFGLIAEGVIQPLDDTPAGEITYEVPDLDHLVPDKTEQDDAGPAIPPVEEVDVTEQVPFSHLHVHTQYSMLQSTADIKALIKKAKEDEQPAIAITDHGNLFGAFYAVQAGAKEGVHVIIGCEVYVVEEEAREKKQFSRENRDRRFPVVLLAKNQEGYRNLCKISSMGFIEGYYDGLPRVSKEIITQYKEHLIVLSGSLKTTRKAFAAPIPDLILNVGETQAEEEFKWWADTFGDDFYVELCRHGLEEENRVNDVMIRMAQKFGTKLVAANNVYYVNKDDATAHDALLCIDSGDYLSTPKGQGRDYRWGMPNDEYYLKTQEEMNALFADLPEALAATGEIVGKTEPIVLEREVLLPKYPIPDSFEGENEYLRHLTYEGAKKRYPELTDEIQERIDHELKIIREMGFPGYFLIVQDFIKKAKYQLDVAVGPGRGSAAGSVVAYCIEITNIDPIRYNLLFERFLNPERVNMPDIDIDFDDDGRGRVIDKVVEDYGDDKVAHIVTYGTMAARSAVRDVGRVLQYPLPDTDKLAKLIPEKPGVSLADALKESQEFKAIYDDPESEPGKVLHMAEVLEGSVRHRGIHAAGVIIAPENMLEYIPVCTAKDADLRVTQFDGKVIEDAGMLKMDFLGLKTLSIIKDAIKIVKENKKIDIDPDEIPLDDGPTYELYQNGDTIGTFQFESEGMREHLKHLKPTNIEDLIAMNALYRPGPMDYIPDFIDRKHGRKDVEYPHELLEDILQPTYGIMVYQEQIMQTAQIIGGFSLGKADLLRRAMGKKKLEVMESMKGEFIKGAEEKNIDTKKATEIFDIMAKFASYGFNRSHSAAYSVLAFQTAYLKANHPAAYMASVLTHNMNDIKKVEFFMGEARKMKIPTLGPDINESSVNFTVNENGEIRFALSAIKGVGSNVIKEIVAERTENGPFANVFDFTKRVSPKAANRKCIESLASAGAFDCFGFDRGAYFATQPGEAVTPIEKAIKFGQQYQRDQQSSQVSLFGEAAAVELAEPELPDAEPWPLLKKLQLEKEYIGIYLTGHPLDNYQFELEHFVSHTIQQVAEVKDREVKVAGVVTNVSHRVSNKGVGFGFITLEDYEGTMEIALFQENYMKHKHLMEVGQYLYVKGKNKYNKWRERWDFETSSIDLLAEIRDKMTNALTLRIQVPALSEKLVEELSALCNQPEGKFPLQLELEDFQENGEKKLAYRLNLHSKSLKINLSDDFHRIVDEHPGISYKIS